MGDQGLFSGLGRSPGGGHGNPLQYSCLENPHGQRSLADYSLWGCKESDKTEWLSTAQWLMMLNVFSCVICHFCLFFSEVFVQAIYPFFLCCFFSLLLKTPSFFLTVGTRLVTKNSIKILHNSWVPMRVKTSQWLLPKAYAEVKHPLNVRANLKFFLSLKRT